MTIHQAHINLDRLQRERMAVFEEIAEIEAEEASEIAFYDDQIKKLEIFIQWPR